MKRLLALVLSYNLRSTTIRGVDAVATLLAFALTAAVTVIVNGLDRGIERAFASSGSEDVLVFTRRNAIAEVQGWITVDTARLVSTLDGLEAPVSRELAVSASFERRDASQFRNLVVRGVDASGIALRTSFRLVEGRTPNARAAEVIAGRRAGERYKGLKVGESFTFGKFTFRTVGAFETGGPSDSEVWGNPSDVQAAFDRAETFTAVRARLKGANADERTRSFERVLAQVANDPRLPFQVEREREYYAKQEESAAEIPRALGRVLALFMAIGAGFGAMNTMYARVASRTREIATLRALGWGKPVIVLAFVAEASWLGLLGGIVGAALALPANGISAGATALTNLSEIDFAIAVTPDGLAQGVLLAVAVAALGGILPALNAARLPIATALKEL